MKAILVPTDFSKPAEDALKYAVELAKKEDAKIFLLHVYKFIYVSPIVSSDLVVEQFRASEQDVLKKLKKICTKIIEKSKINCVPLNREGLVVDTILDIAKKKRINKIVMGTNGASLVSRAIIGSNTAKVVQHANCPVIVIPEGVKYKPIKHITYATDYHASDLISLKNLLETAKVHKAKITLLHISEEQFSPELERQFLKNFSIKIKKKFDPERMLFKLVYGKNVVKRLEEYIKSEPVDMIVMSTTQRMAYEKLFEGSITKNFSYHTNIPLMVFHHKEKAVIFL